MRSAFFILLILLIPRKATAQLAIIKDPDGFCNVRQRASTHSEVLDTLANDRLIFVFEEEAEGDWMPVDYRKGNKSFSGYLHKSRLVLLSKLQKFVVVVLNDTMLKLQRDSLRVVMRKDEFVGEGRQLEYGKLQGEQQYVKLIDGKFPWGTDGNVPRNKYQSIQVKTSSQTINFERTNFEDLFEPNLNLTSAYLDKATNKVYIEAINSDGAGGYVAVWTVEDGRITNREIFIPF